LGVFGVARLRRLITAAVGSNRKRVPTLAIVAAVVLLVSPAVGWTQSVPVAMFLASPNVGCAVPHTVFFTDQSSGPPSSWSWDFGDGGTSTAQNPIHTYITTGDFVATLTAANAQGSDSATTTISISIPVTDFSGTPAFGCGPLDVDFTDSSASTHTIASWAWDFGDGGTSSLQNPTHVFAAPGVFTVTLTATDTIGCTDSITKTNFIQVIGPEVDFSQNATTGAAPFTVGFTDLTVAGAPIVGWSWNFGDGGTSPLQNPSHVYANPGIYDVSLTVADLDGCSRTTTKSGLIVAGPVADVTIVKTDGVMSAVAGQPVNYTITASNGGPTDDPGVTISDAFPPGLACSWTSVAVGGASNNTATGAGDLADTVSLPVGSMVTYTASCTISPAATGSLSNTATITSSGLDPNPADNSATDVDVLTSEADLTITASDGLTSATPGETLIYTIVAGNTGPSDNPTAIVGDVFPASLACTWTSLAAGGATGNALVGAGDVSETLSMPAGSSVVYTASCVIAMDFVGEVTNTAVITSGGAAADPDPSDNSATDTTSVASPAVVSGTKAVTGDLVAGGAITYLISLSNSGLTPQLDNPGNELIDVLPAELAVVSAVATSGTVTADSGSNTITWNGGVPARGGVDITIEANILPGTAGAVIANQATIFFDADGNGSNEASVPTDDPAVGGATDPTEFQVRQAPAIPTLDWAGALLLILCTALGALAILRNRS
jgi:uncharacterized repeat protein (TIGR01451 family)